MKKVLTVLIGIGFLGALLMGPQGFAQSYLEEVRACQYLEQGKIDAAIRLLNRKLQRYPRNFDCHLYLGLAHYLKGDFEKAKSTISKTEQEIKEMSAAPAAITSDQTYADVNRVGGMAGTVFTKGRRGILKFSLACSTKKRGILGKPKKDLKRPKSTNTPS